jgi:hypothetical protein
MKIEVSFWAAAESDGLQQYYDLHSQCPVVCAKTPRTFEPSLGSWVRAPRWVFFFVSALQHALNLSERRRGPVSC